MKEQELLEEAVKYYHQSGKEANAIEAFKKLLILFPDNSKGWTHLATLQNKLTDYDGAINSINNAVKLDYNNSNALKQKCTILSSLSVFPSEGSIYFNEKTREAFEIKSYSSKYELYKDLDDTLLKLIEIEKKNDWVSYYYSWSLCHNKFELGEYEQAINILSNLKSLIPQKYDLDRRVREMQNIEKNIIKNLIKLKRYNIAIKRLQKEIKNQDDDYFLGITLVNIYTELDKRDKREETLLKLLKSNDAGIVNKAELVYILRKFEILKLLDRPNQMNQIINDLKLIININEYDSNKILKIKEDIRLFQENNS